jgi:hypothetical protein
MININKSEELLGQVLGQQAVSDRQHRGVGLHEADRIGLLFDQEDPAQEGLGRVGQGVAVAGGEDLVRPEAALAIAAEEKVHSKIIMNLQHSLDVAGMRLAYGSTVGFVSAGGYTFWDIESGKRETIPSERNGFTCSAISMRRDLLALSEYGLNPSVHIFRPSSKSHLLTIDHIAEFEVSAMEFSYEGKYLAVVKGNSVPEIVFYNLNEEHLEIGEKGSIGLRNAGEVRQITFNPKDSSVVSFINDAGYLAY